MLTLSDVQEQAKELANEIERADCNPLAIGPEKADILDVLRDVQDATNDDCHVCSEVEDVARNLLVASVKPEPDMVNLRALLQDLLMLTGIFDHKEADMLIRMLGGGLVEGTEKVAHGF